MFYFVDDIFGDDGKGFGANENIIQSKKKYLDEDWKLSTTDQKDFKGFAKKDKGVESKRDAGADGNAIGRGRRSTEGREPVHFPCFALMYKFRREFQDASPEAALADHEGYCTNFKRLINSEVIRLKDSKGVVLLWTGLTADDKAETKAEINSFVEDDPLIANDMIEKWEVIDLDPNDEHKEQVLQKKSSLAATKSSVSSESTTTSV